jgi:hypothetical protein
MAYITSRVEERILSLWSPPIIEALINRFFDLRTCRPSNGEAVTSRLVPTEFELSRYAHRPPAACRIPRRFGHSLREYDRTHVLAVSLSGVHSEDFRQSHQD